MQKNERTKISVKSKENKQGKEYVKKCIQKRWVPINILMARKLWNEKYGKRSLLRNARMYRKQCNGKSM